MNIWSLFLCSITVFLLSFSVYAEEPSRDEGDVTKLEEVVVTGVREAEPLKETPSTVGVVKEKEIKAVRPSHPSEVMNRVPGVWVNVTAGEGHMTAIRQPLTGNPVYLFLEDGIPVRSTGFFNHNALYEINIPGADRIEVIKGPGTALYGSDAIGGTINVMTRPPTLTPEIEVNPEMGEDGWYRLLVSGSNTWGDDGYRLDLNMTNYDGWRERTSYKRESFTLRWDRLLSGGASLKTILAYSHIDQDSGGSNGLLWDDYQNRPWYNYQTFDFRRVEAFRLSTTYEREISEKGLLSLIPYIRWNRMDLLPGWGIFKSGTKYYGYDSDTRFYSLGLLVKYRHDLDTWRSRLIFGIDLDYSPGKYDEKRIEVTKTGDKYTSYTYVTNTDNNYDYDATFTGVSPYIQVEASPVERLRFTIGARYDDLSYDYDTDLPANVNRPADIERSFSHVSPKAGLTYAFTQDISGFISYNHAFRVPSSGDLFRGSSGTASTAVNLKPIKVDSYEVGLRGKVTKIITFDTSLYYMTKEDDIVTYTVATNVRERRNAGETEHKGVEIGLGIQPLKEIALNVSYSYARHEYEDYRPSATVDYSGKEIPQAPREMVNTRLSYKPSLLNGGQVELEWVRLGKYWLDDANTERYDGHDLLNIRASYWFNPSWEFYARAINVTDELYAERASKSGTDPAQYAPGQPRTFFAGLTYHWGKR